ncbi:MAG: efflux transporter outer membrane subunit [Caulobacteraceae bacterium]
MRRLLALTAAALSLAGCISLDPAYHRPVEPTPAAFPSGPAYPPRPPAIVPVVGWRDFFADPRLKAVIDRALTDNRDLRLAMANIAAARAQVGVERSALLPHLGAQAGATFGEFPGGTINTGGGGRGTGSFHEHQYTAGLASSWQIDLFGRIQSLTRAAQDQYFATREARDLAQINIVYAVAGDWLTLAADRARLVVANETAVSGAATVALTRQRFEGGIASALDVAQAQTIFNQAQYDVGVLVTRVAQDKNALDLAVGAPVAEGLLPQGLGEPVVVLGRLPAGLDSRMLLGRPDVLQAEDQLRATHADIGAARAAFFPSLSLTGSGGFTSTALSALFSGPAATWTFIPQIVAPIFEGGLNRANLRYARAQREAAVATYEKTIQTAFREVADALAGRGTIDARLAAQHRLVEAAAQYYRLADARYRAGTDTYLNTLVAQRTLYVARLTLVQAQFDQEDNMVTLYAVLGGGL